MKKKLIFLCLIIFTIYILCFPKEAVCAAASGLLLWYERVLPALLPFAILSNIFIYSGYLHYLAVPLSKMTGFILPTSDAGAFVLLSGFLFGFPMGSKNCSELLKSGNISYAEARVLFVITNNISPVFISSYIFAQELSMPSLTLISFLVLYLPPVVLGSILLRKQGGSLNFHDTDYIPEKKPASESRMNFKIIDAGIMNGFETLTRLGGYIMMFSIIASMVQLLPLPSLLKTGIIGITEITNGIHALARLPLSGSIKYLLAIGFTAFGGISGIAQTSSMIQGTPLSISYYIRLKLLLTALSLALALPVTLVFGL